MGGILTSGAGRDFLACVDDNDCWNYKNSAGVTATTEAERKKRCCLRTEITSNSNYPLGATNADLYGWPKVVYPNGVGNYST